MPNSIFLTLQDAVFQHAVERSTSNSTVPCLPLANPWTKCTGRPIGYDFANSSEWIHCSEGQSLTGQADERKR